MPAETRQANYDICILSIFVCSSFTVLVTCCFIYSSYLKKCSVAGRVPFISCLNCECVYLTFNLKQAIFVMWSHRDLIATICAPVRCSLLICTGFCFTFFNDISFVCAQTQWMHLFDRIWIRLIGCVTFLWCARCRQIWCHPNDLLRSECVDRLVTKFNYNKA